MLHTKFNSHCPTAIVSQIMDSQGTISCNNSVQQRIHFVGIGGIGMSGLAELCFRRKIGVITGSDSSDSLNVQRLRSLGITIRIGHSQNHVTKDISLVVVSGAIDACNPEYLQSASLNIPIIRRAKFLKLIVAAASPKSITVTGSHGKTTTTAVTGTILEKAGLNPIIICGGIMNQFNSNLRMSQNETGSYSNEWTVAEVDESDGTFQNYEAGIAIITNISDDHLYNYEDSEQKFLQTFFNYIESQLVNKKTLIVGIDCPRICQILRRFYPELISLDNNVLTFGLNPTAHVRGINLRFDSFGIGLTFDVILPNGDLIPNVTLKLTGEHNVKNALAAISLAHHLGIPSEIITTAVAHYQGVQKRFSIIGVSCGVTVIDDYAVHPSEIEVVLQAAKRICRGQLIALPQIHRYARLQSLFVKFLHCFDKADHIIFGPLYSPKGERADGWKVQMKDLTDCLKEKGLTVRLCQTWEDVQDYVQILAQPRDYVVCLGTHLGKFAASLSKLLLLVNRSSEI